MSKQINPTYAVIARNSQFDDVTANCGHKHTGFDTAAACYVRLTKANKEGWYSARWHQAHIELSNGVCLTWHERERAQEAIWRAQNNIHAR